MDICNRVPTLEMKIYGNVTDFPRWKTTRGKKSGPSGCYLDRQLSHPFGNSTPNMLVSLRLLRAFHLRVESKFVTEGYLLLVPFVLFETNTLKPFE